MVNPSLVCAKTSFPNASNRLQFYVNNDYKELDNVDPKTTLLRFLRDDGYVGVKYGCGEGGCGACCVVVAEYNSTTNQVRYRTANSCLMPLCAALGKQIITVEGLGCPDKPHPIQERFARGNASQCGFCTPGFVMSLYGLLKIKPDPSMSDIEEAFDGNLCRCTGYRSIIDSSRSFVKNHKCSDQTTCKSDTSKLLVDFDQFKEYDPKDDLQFPLDLTNHKPNTSALFSNDASVWLRPSNLEELLVAKEMWPNARLIGGSSEVGVEMNLRALNQPSEFIYVGDLTELRDVTIVENSLNIGINITLTELINSLESLKKTSQTYQKSLLNAFLSNLRWFASRHIRNFATLAGNIATGSPISDLNPILVASDAVLTVRSKKNGERTLKMREFFLAYRKVNLASDEVIIKVTVPLPKSELEHVYAYKQAKRKVDDIALVNGCFRVKLEKTSENIYKIDDLNVSLGGVSPKTVYLNKLSEATKGLVWGDEKSMAIIEQKLLEEVKIDFSAPGAHPTYRRALVVSFFTRFWYQIARDMNIAVKNKEKAIKNIDEIERDLSSSSQDVFSSDHEPHLGAKSPHVASLLHTTGAATFTDDIPKQHKELYAWPVMSSRAHAFILSVDESKALAIKGVHAFISHKDVPNSNIWGIGKDEEYFVSKEVLFHGQLIGLIVAESASLAKLAASLVEVKYEDLKPIITIDDAIEANSFYDYTRTVTNGTIDENTFKVSSSSDDLVFEGSFELGGQEHFYLETYSCLIIPKRESNEIEINSCNQHPDAIQDCASEALGIPKNRIIARCKRIGGGFGGKETRTSLITIPCAVAANKLNRPIRCVLERDTDMIMSGKRHPFKAYYKVRVSKDGMLKAYDVTLISNGGHSYDLSIGVLDRAINQIDNIYKFPNIRVVGKIAKTNIASNTAFRGFGSPQGFAVTENMINEVAEKLGIDQATIRIKNMYKENDACLLSSELKDWYVPEMFNSMVKDFEFDKKRKEIEEFNRENLWKKRGMAITASKYGLAIGLKFLNQGAALCNIYTDGTVLLYTAGIEMGQGLNTKLIHIAANTLQIPESDIHISETATNTVPNGVPTAASVATDLQGGATMKACEVLAERIRPYREKNPNGKLSDWATAAFLDRVSLSATGFYATPNMDYDKEKNTGTLYTYFTTGVSASIVELDILTGDHTILRSDVYMDIGRSINYAVDVGQVEGAFVQGIGYYTIEDLLHVSANGALATKGPGAYKIPGSDDIPQQFNIRFLKDKEYKHLNNVKKSKGVGEPPLQLAFSVFLALKDAVSYARKANGLEGSSFKLNSPATSEALRLACEDRVVQLAKVDPKDNAEKLFFIRP